MKKLLLLILLFTFSLFANTITLISGNVESGSINEGNTQYYTIEATANQTLNILLTQLSADADLYVKIGSQATPNNYDCKSDKSDQNDENCLSYIPQENNVSIAVYGLRTTQYSIKATLSTENNQTTTLQSGVNVNHNVIKNAMRYYKIPVTENKILDVLLSQLSNDADLYVKIGSTPTRNNYDCKSDKSNQSDESCLLSIPQNSDVFIAVYGFETAQYSIKATLSTPNSQTTSLQSDITINNNVVKNEMKYYKISITADKILDVLLEQLSADADLYIKVGSKPTLDSADCKSEKSEQSNETCQLNISEDSDVFIGVYGFETASYQLKATITSQEAPTSITYEDAEDQKIDRWSIVDNIPNGATVSNVYDDDKASRVIKFQGVDSYENQYQIGGAWNNRDNFNITWDMKTTEGYIIDIVVTTTEGVRYLRYKDDSLSYQEKDDDVIIHGLGYFSTDGTWHTHRHNLIDDLQDLEPNNTIISVDSFLIRANASIDNLELFSSPIKSYENAEDNIGSRWSIFAGSDNAQISNVYDALKDSRVISFQGNNSENIYLIGNETGKNGAWRDTKHSNLKWSFNSNNNFEIYLLVNTLKGVKKIKYSNSDIDIKSVQGDEIDFGIGDTASDGKWHTFIRDIEADVEYFDNTNKLLSVDGLLVVGNSKIDDIELFNVFKAPNHKAGFALTFDDYGIESWYAMRDTFLKYKVKATFFVSNFHTLSEVDINKLKTLESDGHEIGCHTFDHEGVGRDYHYDNSRINEYLSKQIIPAFNNMKDAGFNPVSFAYPYGERNEAYDNAVKAYFPYLRTTASDHNRRLSQLEEIFHKKGKHYSILAGDGMDNHYHHKLDEIREAFIKARENGEIITLYSHRIEDDNSSYAISPQKFKNIIKIAQEVGLEFYRFKDAYTIGN